MQTVGYYANLKFEISGEREKEAAEFLRDALTGVAKRKSGYIEGELDAILANVRNDYEVEVKLVSGQ